MGVRCEGVKGATAKPPCRHRSGETPATTKIKEEIVIIHTRKEQGRIASTCSFPYHLTSSQNLSMFPLTTSRLERQKSGFRTSIPTLAATLAIVPEPQERSRRQ